MLKIGEINGTRVIGLAVDLISSTPCIREPGCSTVSVMGNILIPAQERSIVWPGNKIYFTESQVHGVNKKGWTRNTSRAQTSAAPGLRSVNHFIQAWNTLSRSEIVYKVCIHRVPKLQFCMAKHVSISLFNKLGPEQNSCHFCRQQSQIIFFTGNYSILIPNSPKFGPMGPTDN